MRRDRAQRIVLANGHSTTMTLEQWGMHRDDEGVCMICEAQPDWWCDQVAHRQVTDEQARAIALVDAANLEHEIERCCTRLNELSIAVRAPGAPAYLQTMLEHEEQRLEETGELQRWLVAIAQGAA